MKLYYSHNLNPRLGVAVAKHLKSPVTFIRADPRNPAHEEAFRPINPNTLVPVLVEPHQTLWETDAIACRLSQLAGSDFWRTDEKMPQMMMWISWATHHFTRAGDFFYFERLVRPTFSNIEPDSEAVVSKMADFRKFAGILEDLLKGKNWLVDDKLSYADFRVGTVLPFAEKAGLPVGGFPNIMKFSARLDEIEGWREPFKEID